MDKTALTAVIAGIIVLLLAAVAVSGIRKKKRGEHFCSCGGNCSTCGLCERRPEDKQTQN